LAPNAATSKNFVPRPDFLVWREATLIGPCAILRMRQQVFHCGDDFRHAGLVVGTKKRRA
jgi:hypothetical protein